MLPKILEIQAAGWGTFLAGLTFLILCTLSAVVSRRWKQKLQKNPPSLPDTRYSRRLEASERSVQFFSIMACLTLVYIFVGLILIFGSEQIITWFQRLVP